MSKIKMDGPLFIMLVTHSLSPTKNSDRTLLSSSPSPSSHYTDTTHYTYIIPTAYGGSYDVCMALLVNNVNYGAVDKNQRSATDIAKYKGDTTHTHDNTLVPLPPNH